MSKTEKKFISRMIWNLFNRSPKIFWLMLVVVSVVIYYAFLQGVDVGTVNTRQLLGPKNFTEAKQIARQLHADHAYTFYCGCEYDKQGNVDLESCGYKIQKDTKRALRLEWEHIVPVSLWGKTFQCWDEAMCCNPQGECTRGRNCCAQVNPQFAKIEADLHNLVPAIGELNGLRSNFKFEYLPHIKVGQFGECKMKIDAASHQAEPPIEVRGMIARAYLYMSETYHISLSPTQKVLYKRWNVAYPPSEWEILWDKRVARIQGNYNPYIADYQGKK